MLTAAECAAVRSEAWRVLQQNRRRGVSAWHGRAFDFICPSVSHYPFQWFWDSCFHAIALTHFDPDLACRELDGLLVAAEPSGFIPHIVFWEKEQFADAVARYNVVLATSHTTATIQPPVLALALERLAAAGAPPSFVRDALPLILAYHHWLAERRDPDRDGLIAILQPDESGLDAAPKYDGLLPLRRPDEASLNEGMAGLFARYAAHRGDDLACLALEAFHVEDVLVNVIWIEANHALARLLRRFGLPRDRAAGDRADRLDALASQATDALLSRSYDPESGAFYDLAGAAERPVRLLTVTSLLPLFLAHLPSDVAERLVTEHLLDPHRFWLPFPVPSVSAAEPTFEPDFHSGLVWRGPTWMNTNWFLIQGLRRHGFADVAAALVEQSARLVLRSGLRECYDPYTGVGYGGVDFAWSALIVDLLPHRSA